MDNNNQARNASAINENDPSGGNVTGKSGTSRCECDTSGASASGQSACGSSAKDILRRLRAPGMTLTYTMEKQHIPDMDAGTTADGSGQSSGGQSNGGKSTGGQSTGGQSCCKTGGQSSAFAQGGGQAPGTMQCSGTCRVRYFDLAVGVMLMMVLGCAMKCCCSCCRGMKRLF